jgi:hypothetical protein
VGRRNPQPAAAGWPRAHGLGTHPFLMAYRGRARAFALRAPRPQSAAQAACALLCERRAGAQCPPRARARCP